MASLAVILMTTLSLNIHIKEASGKRADVYGVGELSCGDVDSPRTCSRGAITASGAVFDPTLPSIAISLPKRMRIRPTLIWVKTLSSPCSPIWLTDKKHPRHVVTRPWDVSPAAAKVLKFKGTRDILHICKESK